jgi:hypothetical protein
VVAHQDEVELGGVEGVAVEVEQGAVADAVGGDIGVAVEVAAEDPIGLVTYLVAILAEGLGVGGFVGVDGRGVERCWEWG